MSEQLVRILHRPSEPLVYAWVNADGSIQGLQMFQDARQYLGAQPFPDGSRCLPVYGNEPSIDLDRQYFVDDFKVDGDRVVRIRTVHDVPTRPARG